MDKKELQEAQSIINALFYDGKVITGWQHTLLQNVISIAKTKLRKTAVVRQSEQLVDFLLHLNGKGLINNYDFDYEKEAKKYLKKKLTALTDEYMVCSDQNSIKYRILIKL